MKAILLRTFLIFCLLIIGGLIGTQFQKKIFTKHQLNTFLGWRHYHDLIENKELKYDYKTGEYYMEIIFKDEPENRYELFLNGEFFMIAYDQSNSSISDPTIAKYIDNFKLEN